MPNQPSTHRFILAHLSAAVAALGAQHAAGQSINEDLKLTAPDSEGGDQFGWSIGIDNGVVAVGVNGDDDNGLDSGSAYLFNASTGAQLFKLLPNDGANFDEFGKSIAIDSGTVAIGAYRDDDNGNDSGSVYLINASTGAQTFKLLPTDGAAGDWFGFSVAIADGIVAVGSIQDDDDGLNSGSAYLFDASTGIQISKLVANDGAASDFFGRSISIANGVVAVGADGNDDNGSDSGSAYTFASSTGAQIAKLLPSDGASNDQFGLSVAVSNGTVAVGAYRDDDNGSGSGSAYLFNATTGAQTAKILPNDGAASDDFGISLAIDNGVIVIGSRADDDGFTNSGSAYLFDASTGGQLAKLLPSDGTSFTQFGYSVAIDNGTIAGGVGAVGGPGSAYVFSAPSTECLADTNHDGEVSPADFTAWIAAFNSNAPECDQNNDGSCTPADFTAWIANFNAGC